MRSLRSVLFGPLPAHTAGIAICRCGRPVGEPGAPEEEVLSAIDSVLEEAGEPEGGEPSSEGDQTEG